MFDGTLGRFEGKLHLDVDEAVQPVQLPVRKVPIATKPRLQEELARLTGLGVIESVQGPSNWVSSLVIVKKQDGSLRLCLDPKPLNKALKRCHYPMLTMDELLPELSDAKVFTVCGLKNGFWHVDLDESSSLLTTSGKAIWAFQVEKTTVWHSPSARGISKDTE